MLPIWSICAGDLDGDHYTDLVFGGENGLSFVIYNSKDDRFYEFPVNEKFRCQRTTLSDIDTDGDLDALVCNDTGQSMVYENKGHGIMSLNLNLLTTSAAHRTKQHDNRLGRHFSRKACCARSFCVVCRNRI